jgi:hypothetical protein
MHIAIQSPLVEMQTTYERAYVGPHDFCHTYLSGFKVKQELLSATETPGNSVWNPRAGNVSEL